MIANILQLAAGILFAISSFIVKGSFQVPFLGQKLPGSLERFKQAWVIRIGLVLLVFGYAFPIMEWEPHILENYSKSIRIIFAFLITGALVFIGYAISALLAKRDYKNAPVVGDEDDTGMPGMLAFKVVKEDDTKK